MSAKWQRVDISVSKKYSENELSAIGLEIVDFIRKRTQEKGLDKNNRPFARYSKEYTKSLDFKIAGKSKAVDLTLSGDMLGALDVINVMRGKIRVGFENGSQENAKADGNIRGTYGQPKKTAPSRDFLGLTNSDLQRILSKYPPGDARSAERAAERLAAEDAAGEQEVDTE